jgi:hypothetical protein
MNLPCRFSEDSQTIRSGSHGKSELFVTKVDPLDYAMSQNYLDPIVFTQISKSV